MKIIAGLGNPGAKYLQTRHNVGFMAVDHIAEYHQFGNWRRKFNGLAADGQINNRRVNLLKPETYMNESGRSVGEAMRFYKVKPSDVIVIHDELDLPPGRLRAKFSGGVAGHRGLTSVQQHIGNDFARVRIGIGHPGRKDLVKHYVLQNFRSSDHEWLDDLLDAVSHASEHLAAGDLQKFTNAAAEKRMAAPRKRTVDQREAAPPEQPTGLLQKLARRFMSST